MPLNNSESRPTWGMFDQVLRENGTLGAYKFFLVGITQPIVTIIRAQQAAVYYSNKPRGVFSAVRWLYRTGGPRTFYKGAVPDSIQEGLSYLTYKTPLLTHSYSLASGVLPSSTNQLSPSVRHGITSILAGSLVGVVDNVIMGPLEAYSTYRNASQGSHANASFSAELHALPTISAKAQRLWRGFIPSTLKSCVTGSLFFLLNKPIHDNYQLLFSHFGLSDWHHAIDAASALSQATLIATAGAPIDILKTIRQMPHDPNDKLVGQSLFRIARHNIQKHSMGAITAGMPARIALATFGWSCNIFVLNRLKAKSRSDQQETEPEASPNHAL